MRTYLLIGFCLFSGLFAANTLQAQNDTYKNDFSVSAGLNIFMLAKGSDIKPGDTVQFSTATGFGHPTIQFAYDRSLKKWFSIGASFSRNTFGVHYNNLSVLNENFGDLTVKAARNSFNTRLLFHYFNDEKLDLYSGFRLGFSLWTVKANKTLSEAQNDAVKKLGILNKAKFATVLPQAAITLFGLRGHVTENIGVGFEINLGSPYLLAAQADYRF